MSQYFDKDFFKFLLGFVLIIIISCVCILAVRMYQAQRIEDAQKAAVITS